MNKWQIICPLVAMGIVAVVVGMIIGRNHHRQFINARAWAIGKELVKDSRTTNRVMPGPKLEMRLSQFRAPTSGVEDVVLGDEPAMGDGTACCYVMLTNAMGEHLGIRLRQDDADSERFHVVGYWTKPASAFPAKEHSHGVQ